MKLFLLFFFATWCCSLAADKNEADAPKEVKVAKEGMIFTVQYSTNYPDSQACILSYLLTNTSGKKYVMVFSGQTFDPDLQVRLISPGGKVLTAYKDMTGAQFPLIRQQALFTEELVGRGYDMSLDLEYLFPMEEVGEYRCTLTKRVYRQGANGEPGEGALGTPVDLVTPEFKFRIESVGADGKSPLAKWVPSLRKPKMAQPAEDTSSHHSTSTDSPKKSGVAKP